MPGVCHRGTTVVPVKWNAVREENGHRYIEGIAYNAAIRGERKRVTCSDKVWHDGDDDEFYADESVRWTVNELRGMDLNGTPMRLMHSDEEELPPVGEILHNFLDNSGNLHIIAEIPGNDEYGRAAISLVDNGTCHELSVGYPLKRDPLTRVVSHGKIDEISFVDQAHFRGCKVNVKAGKREKKTKAAPYTSYRVVRAGRVVKETGLSAMADSTPPPAKTLSEQLDADLPEGTVPNELVRNLAIIKKKLNDAEKEKAALLAEKESLATENTAAKKRLKEIDDAEKASADEYAAKNAPRAEEITAHMKEIAKMAGVDSLSSEWEKLNKAALMSPDMVSQEVQAVQVACSRGFRQMQARVKELEAQNAQLQSGLHEAANMSHIENAAIEEREERRGVKAGRRNAGMMEPVQEPVSHNSGTQALPAWAARFVGALNANPNGGYVPPRDRVESRNVAARMSTPAPTTPAAQHAQRQEYQQQQQQKQAPQPAPVQKQQPVQQQQPQQQRPNKPWSHLTQKSMSNNPEQSELFSFLQDVMPTTDFGRFAMAPQRGMDLSTPTAGTYYN